MKFKYKVLIINIILLSLSLGVIGYLMIRKNFELALNTQIKNAVIENNLIQSSVEYELLSVINSSSYSLNDSLLEIGNRVSGGLVSSDGNFFIKYGSNIVFSLEEKDTEIPEELFADIQVGIKNYVICDEDGEHFIYVSSRSDVNDQMLNVITKRNIQEAYTLMATQVNYFKVLLIATIIICSIFMYFISTILTRPMEQLNKVSDEFANGNYDARCDVKTDDEIGLLAEKYNNMAIAVSDHIIELNDMIKRRDQFVADFTHEIKTPMTTIIGYADTMRSIELSREDEIMSLSYIFSEGKRLEAMSMKLFDLIYLKQHDIEKQKINITILAEDICTIITPSLNKKEIELISNFENASICCEKDLIKTVFINLIDNARKASETGSKIEFTGKINGDTYDISVTDHGIGMTDED